MNWSRTLRVAGRRLRSFLGSSWRRFICGLFNFRRWILQRRLADYVVFELTSELVERAPVLPRWYAFLPGLRVPLSLEYLDRAFYQTARDPDVKGIVLLVKGGTLSLAKAQSMAALFERFHRWDETFNELPNGVGAKQIIVYLEQMNTPLYLMASAADQIFMPPASRWAVMGLRSEATYVKDTLERIGVQADVVKIAPWKTAYDIFTRSDMSDADREQREWLLDDIFEQIVNGISRGRNLPPEQVKSLIDKALLFPEQALAAGLVDGVLYEDQLPEKLGRPGREARLVPYRQAHKLFLRTPEPRSKKAIGVLSLTGTIVPGSSRRYPIPLPLFGADTLGSNTVQQLIRAAMTNDRLAALVLFVDSPGGSALASDVMWRELQLLSRQKPVVVYMGDVAASGGYYIAAPGRKIIAQSATFTGSIGVLFMKPVTQEMYNRIDAHRVSIQRGENADLFADTHPWRAEQRNRIEADIRRTYHEFKTRVAKGRHLNYEELDPICSGKVWTGNQALSHNLVDELGDFHVAYLRACEMANLPIDGSVRTIPVRPREHLMAQSARSLGLTRWIEWWQGTNDLAAAVFHRDWQRLLAQEHQWLIADGLPRIE